MQLSSMKKFANTFPFKTRVVFISMVLSLFIFSVISALAGNGEFIYYGLVSFIFFIIIVSYYHRLQLTETLLAGIAVHWLLHFMGGTLYLGGVRLYDIKFLPFFRYDNLVHSFGIFVLTFIAYNLLRPYFKPRTGTSLFHFTLLLFLVVMGLGAVSEIFELGAVLLMGSRTGVGDYFNNAWDLVWNAVGSITACLFIARHEHKTTVRRYRKK